MNFFSGAKRSKMPMIFAAFDHNLLKLYRALVNLRKISYFRAVVGQIVFQEVSNEIERCFRRKIVRCSFARQTS